MAKKAMIEREKKRKHLDACLDRRRHFTPFVVSCDGLLGKEAEAAIKQIASKLAVKWKRPYSHVCGHLKARMGITIVRATHMCLRGSRVPARLISNRRMHMEDGAGMAIHGFC